LVDEFDFALNEQCYEFNECNLLTPFIEQNKAVFNAEYNQKYEHQTEFKNLCKDAKRRKFSTLYLPINLDNSFRKSCH